MDRPRFIVAAQARSCPVCGAPPTTTQVARDKRAIDGGPLVVATCGQCGTLYQPTVPSLDGLASWYDYMARSDKAGREPSQLLGRRLERLLQSLTRFRSTGRLLDVGCGRGELALQARQLGWDVHATEISPSCVAKLRPLLGAQLHEGALIDAPFARSSFDVVVMIEVLEHLVDPLSYLKVSWDLLRPGGALFMTTPNYRGLSGRLRTTSWRVVADEHLTYFDERGLRRLLATTGFVGIRITTTGLDVPAVASRLRRVGSTSGTSSHERQGVAATSHRAHLADRFIEIANAALRVTHLGDSLRATAQRPPPS